MGLSVRPSVGPLRLLISAVSTCLVAPRGHYWLLFATPYAVGWLLSWFVMHLLIWHFPESICITAPAQSHVTNSAVFSALFLQESHFAADEKRKHELRIDRLIDELTN